MPAALQHITVGDLPSPLAGPCCTMRLGGRGADVITVAEPERGDATRSWTPLWHGERTQRREASVVATSKRCNDKRDECSALIRSSL
jgi:crotonobetainyl-CoA:carnitine CoA-transferase CaiB-like acyl-CoA transferase